MKTCRKYIAASLAVLFLFALLTAALPALRADASTPGSMVEIRVNGLNVRTGPGTNHQRFHVLRWGTYVTLLGRQGEWLQVRLPWGKVGWIFGGSGYTSLHPIQQYVRVTASMLNVRTGPGVGHPRIHQLPFGTTAPVVDSRNGWQRVIFDTGRVGWVSGAYTESTLVGRGGERVTTVTAPVTVTGTGILRGRTIVVDPGHGGYDPGAVGRSFNLTEKSVNLDTSLRLARLLESTGARVILTRSTDVFITLGQRAAMANNTRADLYISIHANAHPNPAIGGTETYYDTAYRPGDSRRLAVLVQQELAAGLGLRNIGVKTANFHVIRNTTMPSILVELAFLSNTREESLLNQASFRQRGAEAILRGITRYYQ